MWLKEREKCMGRFRDFTQTRYVKYWVTHFFSSKIVKNSLILIANNDTQKKKKKSMELNFKEIEFQLEFFKTGKATSSQSRVAKFSHNS